MANLIIQSPSEKATSQLYGFRYWWLKRVDGFLSGRHCAPCLKGEYSPTVAPHMPTATKVAITGEPGTIFYLCGVENGFRYERNFHLPFVVDPSAEAIEAETFNGHAIRVEGARQLFFNDEAARALFPHKSNDFLRCRNFQFGAHQFKA